MTKKSILALLLVLTMCLSLFPSAAFAAEGVEPAPVPEEEEIVQSGEVEVVSESAENTVNSSEVNSSETVTVTFNANGGTLTGNNTVTVQKGAVVPAEAAPTASKEGEEFTGWYIEYPLEPGTVLSQSFVLGETTVKKDIELTAHYAAADLTKQQQEDIESKGTATGGEEKISGDAVQSGGNDWFGSGTVDAPYQISSVEDLQKLATKVNAGNNYSGVYFQLVSDIDLNSETWTPIGEGYFNSKYTPKYSGASFAGTFDGNYKTISNLSVSTSGENAAGLFGIVKGGTVKNLTVSGANVSSQTRFAGAIVGGLTAGTIEKCTVSGIVNISGRHFVGGVAGLSYDTIKDCTVTATGMISADDTRTGIEEKDRDGDDVGGIVGYSTGSVSNSHVNSANLTVQGIRQVGGVMGNGKAPTDSSSNANVVYTIASAAQLAAFEAAVNAGDTFAGKTVKLVSNIDLAGTTWTPIGEGYYVSGNYSGYSFAGTFDGNGKMISNLSVSTSDNNAAGLFGIINGGTVKNLTVSGANVSSAERFAGAIVGGMPAGTIENCTVSGDVAISGKHFVGGVAGMSYGTITGCTVNATGTISADDASGEDGDDVGGVVGFVQTANGRVINSKVDSTGLTLSGIRQVGGVAGAIDNNASIDSASSAKGVTVKSIATTETVTAENKPTNTIGLVVGRISKNATSAGTATGSTLEVALPGQLSAVAAEVNAGNSFAGNTVKLTASFDYTGASIGSTEGLVIDGNNGSPKAESTNKFFAGTFDGNDNTISGLTAPLFGAVNGATIKDLKIDGATISGSSYVGSIGYAYDSAITNVDVQGTLAIEGTHFVGGLVGYAAKTAISNSDVTASGTIKADDANGEDGDDVGGLVGYFGPSATLDTCSVNNANLKISGQRQVGGLAGLSSAGGAITNCSVSGVTVESITNVKTNESKAVKIAFGGMVGGFNSSCGAVSGTVSNVTLSDGSGAVTQNVRKGLVSAGRYASNGNNTLPAINVTVTGSTIEISTADQLAAIAAEVNAGNSFAGNTVELTASFAYTGDSIGSTNGLSINGNNGSPKAESTNKFFAGTFDGNDNTISGLTAPLFGAVNGATIKDLKIDGATISGSSYVGSIGYAYDSAITNVDVQGTLAIEGTHFVGGLVGYAAKTAISNSDVTASGTIKAYDAEGEDGDDVGGLVGFIVNACSISGSHVSGVKVSGSRQCGGLVGFINGATAQSTVSGTVSNVEVECIANDAVFSSKANKVAFGGLVGSMTNVNLGTEISGTVRDVHLTVGSSVSEDNKGKVRLGFVTGGDYNKENFVAANAMAGEIIVIDCTKVAGTKPVDTPSVLIDGPHEHTYGAPYWDWYGTTAIAIFRCVECDSIVEQPATMTRSSSEAGKVTFTATAASPNGDVYTDSEVYGITYTVIFKGVEYSYDYGAVAHFHSDTPVDWKVYAAYGGDPDTAVTRAKACTDFYFAVTESVNVTTDIASTEHLEVINIKKAEGGSKTMTYQVQWSLPANATNVKAVIHRTRDDEAHIDAEELLVKPNHKVWDTNMNTRNGDYTYNVIKLTGGSTQAIMIRITYDLNGVQHTKDSGITYVHINN